MSTALLWLRNDLRLVDNPALEAAAGHDRMLPVFIGELVELGLTGSSVVVNGWA